MVAIHAHTRLRRTRRLARRRDLEERSCRQPFNQGMSEESCKIYRNGGVSSIEHYMHESGYSVYTVNRKRSCPNVKPQKTCLANPAPSFHLQVNDHIHNTISRVLQRKTIQVRFLVLFFKHV